MIFSFAVISSCFFVQGGNHSTNWLVLVGTIMIGIQAYDHQTTHLAKKQNKWVHTFMTRHLTNKFKARWQNLNQKLNFLDSFKLKRKTTKLTKIPLNSCGLWPNLTRSVQKYHKVSGSFLLIMKISNHNMAQAHHEVVFIWECLAPEMVVSKSEDFFLLVGDAMLSFFSNESCCQ